MPKTSEEKLKFIKCLRGYDKELLSEILTKRIVELDNIVASKRIPEKESHRTIRSLSDELDTALSIRDIINDTPNCWNP